MASIRAICLAVLAIFCFGAPAHAQVATVPCIDTCTGSLRSLTASPGTYVFAAGFYQQGDSSGGLFYEPPGPGPGPLQCPTLSQAATWSTTIPYVLGFSGSTNITVGMAIVPGQTAEGLRAYDNVVGVDTVHHQITLAAPVTASSSGTVNVNFSGDDSGSTVRDSETTPLCYSRAISTYSPKEWAAKVDQRLRSHRRLGLAPRAVI